MSRSRVISLEDVPGCPASVTALYDKYRERITGIKTVQERSDILSDMQRDYKARARLEPQNMAKLTEVCQLLKQKCWEVVPW